MPGVPGIPPVATASSSDDIMDCTQNNRGSKVKTSYSMNVTIHTGPEASKLEVHHTRSTGSWIEVPQSREKWPMGGAPYIRLRQGGGSTFEVSI